MAFLTVISCTISNCLSCSLIRGVGEVDLKLQDEQHENDVDQLSARSSQSIVMTPDVESLPYLLLDIRTPDDYEKCHIIGGTIVFETTINCCKFYSNIRIHFLV